MAAPRKAFGKRDIRPPPVITHAPHGLAGGPEPPSPRQMRTLAITLGLLGATAFGAYTAAHNHREDCAPPEGSNPNGPSCQSSGSSSGHGGSGGRSGYSGSSSSGRESVSFGGFGHAGAAHGGGGGE